MQLPIQQEKDSGGGLSDDWRHGATHRGTGVHDGNERQRRPQWRRCRFCWSGDRSGCGWIHAVKRHLYGTVLDLFPAHTCTPCEYFLHITTYYYYYYYTYCLLSILNSRASHVICREAADTLIISPFSPELGGIPFFLLFGIFL